MRVFRSTKRRLLCRIWGRFSSIIGVAMSWKSLFYATAFVASLCLPHSPMGALAQSLPAMPEDNATLSHATEDNSAAERSMKDNSAEMGGAGISGDFGRAWDAREFRKGWRIGWIEGVSTAFIVYRGDRSDRRFGQRWRTRSASLRCDGAKARRIWQNASRL